MTARTHVFPLALAGTLAFSLPAAAADYVQSSGALSFASAYQGETFTGLFPDFSTTLSFDPAAPQDARLEVTIPLASADTKSGDRDGTLKTADFFDVARFGTARYTAHGFRRQGDGSYIADGTLELRGVRKTVPLTFTWTPGERPVLAGRATVKRLDFGVGAGDWGDVSIIPDEVAISTKVSFRPKP